MHTLKNQFIVLQGQDIVDVTVEVGKQVTLICLRTPK